MPADRRPVLIVFARAPRLGGVKRRLAVDGIGAVAALRFHRVQLAATLRRLARDRRWRCLLAITPDRAAVRWRGLAPPPGPCILPQGQGDIGARMARAMRPHRRRVVLVGSDIPGLAAADVAAAFRALAGRADVVFGPAEDGGYWLVGLGPRRPPRLFGGRVRWSGPHALTDTLANCAGRRVLLLRRLRDVDTAADLAAVRRRRRPAVGERR